MDTIVRVEHKPTPLLDELDRLLSVAEQAYTRAREVVFDAYQPGEIPLTAEQRDVLVALAAAEAELIRFRRLLHHIA